MHVNMMLIYGNKQLTTIVCDIFYFRLLCAEHKVVHIVAIFPDSIIYFVIIVHEITCI